MPAGATCGMGAHAMKNVEPPTLEMFLQAYHAASDQHKRAGLLAAMKALQGDHPGLDADELLTARKLAKCLSIDPTTVWRWRFPADTSMGRPRYRLSQCLAYLQSDAFKLRRHELQESRRRRASRTPTRV